MCPSCYGSTIFYHSGVKNANERNKFWRCAAWNVRLDWRTNFFMWDLDGQDMIQWQAMRVHATADGHAPATVDITPSSSSEDGNALDPELLFPPTPTSSFVEL